MALLCYDQNHEDVMICTHNPHYWPFVWGIHWGPVDSPHKRPVKQSFDIALVVILKVLYWAINIWPSHVSHGVSFVSIWENWPCYEYLLKKLPCYKRIAWYLPQRKTSISCGQWCECQHFFTISYWNTHNAGPPTQTLSSIHRWKFAYSWGILSIAWGVINVSTLLKICIFMRNPVITCSVISAMVSYPWLYLSSSL